MPHPSPTTTPLSSTRTSERTSDRSAGTDFVFPPDSMIWKIYRENFVLLGGPTAAILQIAHPLIGRGVAQHSNFVKDSQRRLEHTLHAIYTITFGTKAQAREVQRTVAKAHRPVKSAPGETPEYSAFDSDLMLWVIATLARTSMFLYERWVAPVPLPQKNTFYQDLRVFGTYFGLATTYGPQNWSDFLLYYEEMIQGPLLGSDPVCAEVAKHVHRPVSPFLFRLGTIPTRFLATELLPLPLARRLKLRPAWLAPESMDLLDTLLPTSLPHLPPVLRFTPGYLQAQKKLLGTPTSPSALGFGHF